MTVMHLKHISLLRSNFFVLGPLFFITCSNSKIFFFLPWAFKISGPSLVVAMLFVGCISCFESYISVHLMHHLSSSCRRK